MNADAKRQNNKTRSIPFDTFTCRNAQNDVRIRTHMLAVPSNSWLVAVNEIMVHCGERTPAPPTNYPVTVILLRSLLVDKH